MFPDTEAMTSDFGLSFTTSFWKDEIRLGSKPLLRTHVFTAKPWNDVTSQGFPSTH
jgi:hypothetical protein